MFVAGTLAAPPEAGRPGLLCDRDGTIIEDRPAYVRAETDLALLPGAVPALLRAQRAGLLVAMVSNQSAVGRGLLTHAEMIRLHLALTHRLAAAGVEIAGSFLCPHRPEAGCPCRKPAPGLVTAALDRFALDPGRSFVVGDAVRDMAAARDAGVRGLLVGTGHPHSAEELRAQAGLFAGTQIVPDLPAAVEVAVAALAGAGRERTSSAQATAAARKSA